MIVETVPWYIFKKTVTNTRTLLETGPKLLVADEQPVCVVMSVEDYMSIQSMPSRAFRRIEGKLYFEIEAKQILPQLP